MNLAFDETIGWYDPRETYCANSCGRPAVGESLIGILIDTTEDDGLIEQVELLCDECLQSKS